MELTWSPSERRAWAWPPAMLPSAWAEKWARIPSNGINPEPGPYHFARTPFWREVVDTVADRNVEEVCIVAPTQVGKTTSIINLLGYWIDHEPGAALLMLPDEQAAREYMAEKVLPFVKQTPRLARHLTGRPWDEKAVTLQLDTMPVFAGWAGSPMRAASRAVRYLLCSEAHKFPQFSGKESDPISLGLKRVSNWGSRAKVVIEGTPTTRDTVAWRRYESCADRREFWTPCPACGVPFVADTAMLRWPDLKAELPERVARAEKIKSEGLAWLECPSCKAHIPEREKAGMLSGGRWASQDQVVTLDGRVVGPRPVSRRIGFHLHGICSPWLTWSQLASEKIAAGDDPALLMDFANSREARPFEQQIQVPTATAFDAKIEAARAAGFKPRVIPAWAGVLLATVDVQKAGFWVLWRAWGAGYKSRLIWHEYVHGGRPDEWDGLFVKLTETRFELEGAPGQTAGAEMVLVDSGGGTALSAAESRTQEVYHCCERAPGWLIPIKGASHEQIRTIQASSFAKDAHGKPVPLYIIAGNRLKSELMRRVGLPAGYDGEWQLHADVDAEYLRHVTAEHEVIVNIRNGARGWVQKHKENHLWDCEVYQLAAAELAGVGQLPTAEQRTAQATREAGVAIAREQEQQGGTWATAHKGRW